MRPKRRRTPRTRIARKRAARQAWQGQRQREQCAFATYILTGEEWSRARTKQMKLTLQGIGGAFGQRVGGGTVSLDRHLVQREAAAVCLGRIEEAMRTLAQERINSPLRTLSNGLMDVSEIEQHTQMQVNALCDAYGVARQPVVFIEEPPFSRNVVALIGEPAEEYLRGEWP